MRCSLLTVRYVNSQYFMTDCQACRGAVKANVVLIRSQGCHHFMFSPAPKVLWMFSFLSIRCSNCCHDGVLPYHCDPISYCILLSLSQCVSTLTSQLIFTLLYDMTMRSNYSAEASYFERSKDQIAWVPRGATVNLD